MIELHLIGYTAELGHLVVDLVGGDEGRYRVRVDEDLFATLDELRERRRGRGLPVGDLVEFADDLGLTRGQLQQLQDDDARADAAAGRISTGAAAAEWVLDQPSATPDRPDEPDAPTEAADEVSPTVLPGWEDEATHDHVAGDPVVFAPTSSTPPSNPEPDPEPDREPAATPLPDADTDAAPRPEPSPPAAGSAPDDEASVRIVPAPPRRPVPDESEGLVARALASHGLIPEPAEPPPSTEWPDTPEPPVATSDPAEDRVPPRPLVDPPLDRGSNGHTRDPHPARDPATVSAPDPEPAPAPARAPEPESEPEPEPESERRPTPVLSPAEIQSRLRAGRSVRAVARAAGVDEERIRRWEVPIVAERARILDQARALRLERPRLGRSSQPLGEAVRRNLASRGVARDDVVWETSRRRDGRWRVCVRYVSRGRKRSATWTYEPEGGELRAASDSARELGFVRRRRR